MQNVKKLSDMTLAALVALHNTAIDDYAPQGASAVAKFKSKAAAIEAIEAMCATGNLAIAFDGNEAVIVDATPPNVETGDAQDGGEGGEGAQDGGEGAQDGGEGGEGAQDGGEGAQDGGEGDAPAVAVGDGKGGIARSGFVYASDEWLKAHPRGTPERKAYRELRKRMARNERKAKEKATEAAVAAALAAVKAEG